MKTINKCRSCKSKELIKILSLGEQEVSDFVFKTKTKVKKVPLELVLCGECSLLQLKHEVSLKSLYYNYWYKSGTNKSMRLALKDVVRNAEQIIKLKKSDLVLDIGCNDGTLLRCYKTSGLKLVGFDPAKNLLSEARKDTSKIVNDFFSFNAFQNKFKKKKAKIITSIAMFYDLSNPNKFVSDIKKVLHSEGVWIIQMSYLPSMLLKNAFDNICHEHLEYYSLTSLENLLRKHGLNVIGVELNEVNGGSFRVFIKHSESIVKMPTSLVLGLVALREAEKDWKLNSRKPYLDFAKIIRKRKRQLVGLIRGLNKEKKRVFVYGASTKGNTLLQYYGLSNKDLPFALERNLDKVRMRTVGSNILIVSEEEGRRMSPDFLLVLPWHFLEEFKVREKKFLEGGGSFIVPLPEVKVISKEGLSW